MVRTFLETKSAITKALAYADYRELRRIKEEDDNTWFDEAVNEINQDMSGVDVCKMVMMLLKESIKEA